MLILFIILIFYFLCLFEGGAFNGQALSPVKGYVPDINEVTHLLDNQFAVLQHLEGQVEFYKVSLNSYIIVKLLFKDMRDSKLIGN